MLFRSIHDRMTATELYEEVNRTHIRLIETYWEDIVNNHITLRKQNEELATIWEGRKPEDGKITGDMTMREADRLVRAVTHPYPGAFYYKEGKKITVWSAEISEYPEENSFRLKDGYLNLLEYEMESYEKDEDSVSG